MAARMLKTRSQNALRSITPSASASQSSKAKHSRYGLSLVWPDGRDSPERCSHFDATLYILYGKSLMKYTGWCQNDFNVQD